MKIFAVLFFVIIAIGAEDTIPQPPFANTEEELATSRSSTALASEHYGTPDLEEQISDRLLNKSSKQNGRREVNPVKMLAQVLLGAYSRFVSSQDSKNCQFKPSCSAYAKDAFRKNNPVKASLLTSDRLLRCHPLAGKYYQKSRDGHLLDEVQEGSNE